MLVLWFAFIVVLNRVFFLISISTTLHDVAHQLHGFFCLHELHSQLLLYLVAVLESFL